MKRSLRKLGVLTLEKHHHHRDRSNILPLSQLEDLAQATQVFLFFPFNFNFRVQFLIHIHTHLFFHFRTWKTWETATIACFPRLPLPPTVLMVWYLLFLFLSIFFFKTDQLWKLSSLPEFSESLGELGSCLLQNTALHDDEESGTMLLSLLHYKTHSSYPTTNWLPLSLAIFDLMLSCRQSSHNAR